MCPAHVDNTALWEISDASIWWVAGGMRFSDCCKVPLERGDFELTRVRPIQQGGGGASASLGSIALRPSGHVSLLKSIF